jgi:trimeric autotransporter adhesin
VAPGVEPTDAVNLNQFNSGLGQVSSELGTLDNRLSGGIAEAAALGGAMIPDQGRSFVGVSGATYNGQGGFALGVVRHLEGSGLVLSGGVAIGSSGSQAIGRVGIGWVF